MIFGLVFPLFPVGFVNYSCLGVSVAVTSDHGEHAYRLAGRNKK